MAKIPFDIKYRPQIESGEYKVITAKEQPVRIICWDRSTTYWKIIALVLAPNGKTENPFTYDVNGKESDGCLHNHELDLFLITPEPELKESRDEKVLKNCIHFLELQKAHHADTSEIDECIASLQQERLEVDLDLDALVNEAFDKYCSVDGYGQIAVSFNRAELYSFITKIARKLE